MAEVPKSLLEEIKSLEEQLTVPKEKLKAITDHFVKELEKGKNNPAASYGHCLLYYRSERRGWQHCGFPQIDVVDTQSQFVHMD